MDRYSFLTGQKIAAIFLGGIILFNYPVLSLFSTDGLIWGIPSLYVYVFLAWAAIIALLALVVETRK